MLAMGLAPPLSCEETVHHLKPERSMTKKIFGPRFWSSGSASVYGHSPPLIFLRGIFAVINPVSISAKQSIFYLRKHHVYQYNALASPGVKRPEVKKNPYNPSGLSWYFYDGRDGWTNSSNDLAWFSLVLLIVVHFATLLTSYIIVSLLDFCHQFRFHWIYDFSFIPLSLTIRYFHLSRFQ